jgi:hypothetical protein
MDNKQYKKFRKDMKHHGRKCWKCGYPKRDGCKGEPSCSAIHCACAMTDPDIKD